MSAPGRISAPICGNEAPHEPHSSGWYEPGKPAHHGFASIMCVGVSAPQIKPGDRVSAQTHSRFKVREGMVDAVQSDGRFIMGGRVYSPEHLTLVEVAHYAPPGVPMVAMTPERRKALHTLDDATARFRTADETVWARGVVMKMLAEARK